MTQNDATLAQIRASDPTASTWVSANAGSGKTRVLTDRVARLLLRGTEPQKILCLTYTKAAASHMQNQLFARLGEWAMLDNGDLRTKLSELGEDVNSVADLGAARTLFARALETPGGLKIQTIHSFCASLLRRFPLEAGVSPQFQEMDDRSGKRLRADILEDMAEGETQGAFDAMARHLSGDDADTFAQEVAGNRARFARERTKAELWVEMGLPEGFDSPALLEAALPDWAEGVLVDLRTALRTGGTNDNKAADALERGDLGLRSLSLLRVLEWVFLTGSGPNKNLAKIGKFPTKAVRENHPDLMEAVEHLMRLAETARQQRRALDAAAKTHALHQFAAVFLPEYAQRKQQHGWLDFDDQILLARGLLTDRSMTQWVLFKLDGGIDHILVDEAQDTSPGQWDVVAKLAEEFTSGLGARDIERTVFVVGDEKQSIYSFQGADPAAFGQMHDHFDTSLKVAGPGLARQDLLYSFRSSGAILRLVDGVFQPLSDSFTATALTHRAFHNALPGRVDLWPFVEKDTVEEAGDWFEPVDTPAPDNPGRRLATQIADQIKASLESEQTLITTSGVRKIEAGDFLILVQRRSGLFHEIIRALKEQNLPVAGADRLKVGAELAVKDLMALLAFLVTPEDSMALACALRSPLFCLSEADLFTVAHKRSGSLWQSLRAHSDQFPNTLEILNDLLGKADFERPYEVLERILTVHNGRNNLIARLGTEAVEGIDALLAQALAYEQAEPPSLTGFLGWMDAGDVDVKRQMDTAGDQIRVMTVHGAKGLESRIVILPDTANWAPRHRGNLAISDNDIPLWKTRADDSPRILEEAVEHHKTRQAAENLRLLYVALTRAENWLIVCGAGDRGKGLDSWYNRIEAGLQATGSVEHSFSLGPGRRYETGDWGVSDVAAPLGDDTPQTKLPDWAKTPAATPQKPEPSLSPSDLGGAKIVSGASEGLNEDQAKQKGRQIHLLLEVLPNHPRDSWEEVSANLLSSGKDAADTATQSVLLKEAAVCLDNPDLAFLFDETSLAEVGIAARPKQLGGRDLVGFIDRLLISQKSVLAVDFKTNAEVPTTNGDVPLGILRQMGAYQAALSEIYPDRDIETAILWTRTGHLMPLAHKIVTDALRDVVLP